MKLMQKFNRTWAFCICVSVLMSLCLFTVPASAAEASSEFDFSAEDSIDAYDAYEKEEIQTDEGVTISRVYAAAINYFKTKNGVPVSPAVYRYGAYLRNSEELQRYYFKNLDFGYKYSTVCHNTLTIYADPEVEFELTDMNGTLMADKNGVKSPSLVNYFKRSTDNGNSVYFIELVPMKAGQADCTVTFWTNSENTRPHYSFWFGSPLVRTAIASLGTFSVSASAPNTITPAYLSPLSTLPQRAWVNNITVQKTSSIGDSNVSSVKLNFMLPGATTGMNSQSVSSTMVFSDFPNSHYCTEAKGTYKIFISSISWASGASTRGQYTFRGLANVEYLYAFGA